MCVKIKHQKYALKFKIDIANVEKLQQSLHICLGAATA